MSDKKNALVTGASRGIGKAIAERLARDGANVGLVARSRDALEGLAKQLSERHADGRFEALECDVADPDAVAGLVRGFAQDFGSLDMLVNNAGITRDGLILRMSEDDWDTVMAVNLRSQFSACKAAARHMLRQRSGRIVNITSVVGMTGNVGQANYAASKGGVIAFTYSLAKELASRGITVNAVAPGFVETEMTAAMEDQAAETFASRIPLGRFGSAEDVAGVVSFLCSDDAAYITGEVIRVDGGLGIA